jgi:hypothetical protein
MGMVCDQFGTEYDLPKGPDGSPFPFDLEGETFRWVNAPSYAAGYGSQMAGKPLHAVGEKSSKSLCGIRRQVWAFDLFNDAPCIRCAKIAERRLKANTSQEPS